MGGLCEERACPIAFLKPSREPISFALSNIDVRYPSDYPIASDPTAL